MHLALAVRPHRDQLRAVANQLPQRWATDIPDAWDRLQALHPA